MKVNELRIGNYIEGKDGSIDEVRELAAGTGLVGKINDNPGEGYFKPIRLTEEWLVKFGLAKSQYSSMDIVRYNIDETLVVKLYSGGGGSIAHQGIDMTFADYVHELQNFYFMITGEDLTVELT